MLTLTPACQNFDAGIKNSDAAQPMWKPSFACDWWVPNWPCPGHWWSGSSQPSGPTRPTSKQDWTHPVWTTETLWSLCAISPGNATHARIWLSGRGHTTKTFHTSHSANLASRRKRNLDSLFLTVHSRLTHRLTFYQSISTIKLSYLGIIQGNYLQPLPIMKKVIALRPPRCSLGRGAQNTNPIQGCSSSQCTPDRSTQSVRWSMTRESRSQTILGLFSWQCQYLVRMFRSTVKEVQSFEATGHDATDAQEISRKTCINRAWAQDFSVDHKDQPLVDQHNTHTRVFVFLLWKCAAKYEHRQVTNKVCGLAIHQPEPHQVRWGFLAAHEYMFDWARILSLKEWGSSCLGGKEVFRWFEPYMV